MNGSVGKLARSPSDMSLPCWSSTKEVGGTLGDPSFIWSTVLGRKLGEKAESPCLLVFLPESQTFPSSDWTLAHIDREAGTATLYHTSVSIDTKHFARTSRSKNGHLPLDMSASPPALLRSERSKSELAKYKQALLSHRLLQGFTIRNCYAVFDENAVDLVSPTPPFSEAFWVMSTQPLSNLRKLAKN